MSRALVLSIALSQFLAACAPASPPHGRDILYVTEPGGRGTGLQIWRSGPEGSNPRAILSEGQYNNFPVWSPDGSQILFMSNRDHPERIGIYIMDADGSNIRAVGPSEWAMLAYPQWSPDGGEIMFSAGPSPLDMDLYVMSVDGSGVEQLTSGRSSDRCAQWAPDGSRVVFTSNLGEAASLIVLDLRSGSTESILPEGFDAECADWSPDGTRIAFASPPDHDIPDLNNLAGSTLLYEIYVLDLETGAVDQLTSAGGMSTYPRWSADGRRIAFHSTRDFGTPTFDDPQAGTWLEIYTMNADGSNVRRLTDNDYFDGHPSWWSGANGRASGLTSKGS